MSTGFFITRAPSFPRVQLVASSTTAFRSGVGFASQISCHTTNFAQKYIEKAKEYIKTLAKIDPRRLKYGDEKSLKGKSIFNRKARQDVKTGIIPATMTDPDLRNTYSIIGICGISRRSTPVRFRITDATVDAELFAMEIEASISSKFLRAGDVLVLDNAANHLGKENNVLEDWLWEYHRIFALFLPAGIVNVAGGKA